MKFKFIQFLYLNVVSPPVLPWTWMTLQKSLCLCQQNLLKALISINVIYWYHSFDHIEPCFILRFMVILTKLCTLYTVQLYMYMTLYGKSQPLKVPCTATGKINIHGDFLWQPLVQFFLRVGPVVTVTNLTLNAGLWRSVARTPSTRVRCEGIESTY